MRVALAALGASFVAVVAGGVSADASQSNVAARLVDLAWSPNGKWLAFTHDPQGPATPSFVSVVRLDRKVQWRGDPTSRVTVSLRKWSPDSKQLAIAGYRYDPDLRFITWITSADGRNVRRFEGLFDDWSPDGRSFLLEREGQLFVVDGQTGAARFLVEGSVADWSPDGKRIAFTAVTRRAECDRELRIFSVNADGTGRAQLSGETRPFSDEYTAEWAPDSSRLAYYETPSDDCLLDGVSSLFIVPADGTRRATKIGLLSFFVGWSPGGRRIAVSAGHRLSILKPSGARAATFSNVEGVAGWGPSGGKVVFDAVDPFARQGRIYVAPADGSARPRLIAQGKNPVWSTLGWIAFANRGPCPASGDQVYVVRPDGRRRHVLSRCRPKRTVALP